MMKYQKPNEETPVLALIRKKNQKLKQNIRVRKKNHIDRGLHGKYL